MTLSFDCPRCGKSLKAPEAAAGKTAECKFCHNKITIPQAAPDKTHDSAADQLAFDMISSTVRTRSKDPRAMLVVESLSHEILGTRAQYAPLLQKAIWLYECQLTHDAQLALIDFLVQKQIDSLEKSAAMYLLGLISFEENKIQSAVNIWRTLVEEFPDSYEGKLVADLIPELLRNVQAASTEYIDEVRASIYIKNGDSWLDGKDPGYFVDNAYINHIEASVHWYDKAIAEFPKSAAARLAHERKLQSLIGWKDKENFGIAHGAMGEFAIFMPKVLEAFRAFEKAFPDAPSLQPIRFQIAQLYWANKDFSNTELWLKKVVDHGEDEESFYVDLANRRLHKLSASI
jgi:tetratricopeptide (TPR) repeat protein